MNNCIIAASIPADSTLPEKTDIEAARGLHLSVRRSPVLAALVLSVGPAADPYALRMSIELSADDAAELVAALLAQTEALHAEVSA